MPQVSFVIGGVQKGGTSALADFIARHSQVALPKEKEAHVFDDAAFDDSWSPAELDRRYLAHFDPATDRKLLGDATPIYVLHPSLIRRIAAYNPAMKWVLILRHPVERAFSQYHMEKSRGREHAPFWLALWRERHRLRGHEDDFSRDSPLSKHSYRLRGDYARQLDALYAHFPREQVLVLMNHELADDPQATVRRVLAFLGLAADHGVEEYPRVFDGDYRRIRRGSLRWRLYEWWFRRELREARSRHGIDWKAGTAAGAGR